MAKQGGLWELVYRHNFGDEQASDMTVEVLKNKLKYKITFVQKSRDGMQFYDLTSSLSVSSKTVDNKRVSADCNMRQTTLLVELPKKSIPPPPETLFGIVYADQKDPQSWIKYVQNTGGQQKWLIYLLWSMF